MRSGNLRLQIFQTPIKVSRCQPYETNQTDPQRCYSVWVFVASVLLFEIVALGSLVSFADFPQLYSFICQTCKKWCKQRHANVCWFQFFFLNQQMLGLGATKQHEEHSCFFWCHIFSSIGRYGL